MSGLEEIARIARDMPITDPRSLGPLAVRLSECYAQVAEDSRQAFATVPSPDVAQRLRVAVQQLGTANIELVKVAGQRRAHPQDQVSWSLLDYHLSILANSGGTKPLFACSCRACASSSCGLASRVEGYASLH
jgi:hypothetical protein